MQSRGFSLVEVMVSLAVLTAFMLGSYALYSKQNSAMLFAADCAVAQNTLFSMQQLLCQNGRLVFPEWLHVGLKLLDVDSQRTQISIINSRRCEIKLVHHQPDFVINHL